MGNAAAKEAINTTPLGDGKLEDSMIIAPGLVTTAATVLKGKNKLWVIEESDATFFKFKSKGLFKTHSLVEDAKGTVVATVITKKTGLASSTNYICKSTPTFEGQEKLDAEQLKKSGIDEGVELYAFGIIDTKLTMASAKSTYSVITGKEGDDFALTEVYTAEKLSAMNFYAMFKQGDTLVAKAHMKGMTVFPTLEVAAGVDVLAIVCIGNTLVGDSSSAGAMAGAGVV